MLVKLGENGIKELDDFAELATDELVDPNDGLLREFELDEDTASAMIMVARAHWFADEEQPAVPVDTMEPGATGAAADAAGTDEA
jgi:N utilization substance protein A